MVWNAQEHSPSWTVIEVIGVSLNDQIVDDLDEEGCMTATLTGFKLTEFETASDDIAPLSSAAAWHKSRRSKRGHIR
jgi:hypothetical protein